MRFLTRLRRGRPHRHVITVAAVLTLLVAIVTLGELPDPDPRGNASPAIASSTPGEPGGDALASTAAGRAAGDASRADTKAAAAAAHREAARAKAARRAAARERSLFNRLLAPGRFAYHEIVRRAAARYRVEHRLVMAIIASESGGDPTALSPAGAIGLMQLMPETAERLGVDPWDPEQNIDGAVRYLASQLSTFKSVDLSLIAYNAGPGFAEKYRRGHVELGAETRAFLTRVGYLLQ